MGFCFEIKKGFCNIPVRSTVCTALCHYIVHGIFIVSFAFTNTSFPAFHIIDYVFGGCGGGLLLLSLITIFLVDRKSVQFLRALFCFLIILTVLAVVCATFAYTIIRWDDVNVTAFMRAFRKSDIRFFPDEVWYALSVIACLNTPLLLGYLIYVMSFMCNEWKSFLFTTPYQNNKYVSALPAPITLKPDVYSTREHKPYPIQRLDPPNNR